MAAKKPGGFRVERIHCFLALFTVVYLTESMGGMYILSAVQNIEKQFHFPSKMSGFLVSATDIGYIPTVIFIAYFGAKGNRARWIGAGTLGMALAYIAVAAPNFLFQAAPPIHGSDFYHNGLKPSPSLLATNVSFSSLLSYPLIADRFPDELAERLAQHKFTASSADITLTPPNSSAAEGGKSPYLVDDWLLDQAQEAARAALDSGSDADASRARDLLRAFVARRDAAGDADTPAMRRAAMAPFAFCAAHVNRIREQIMTGKCAGADGSAGGAFLVFTAALVLLGVGRTLPWSLGVPLLDDNVSKSNMPIFFGFISFMRILGPILGFLIASVVNSFYYTLHAPEGLTPSDASWIGAWWIGFLIIAAFNILPSLGLCLFPATTMTVTDSEGNTVKEINLVDKHKKCSGDSKKSTIENIKEFGRTYAAVLRSRVYLYSIIGRILDMLALKGYMVFLPKYLESYFGIPRFLVHRYMAMFGTLGFASGCFTGGFLLKKFRMSGRRAALFVLLVSLLNISVYTFKLVISCESVVGAIGTASRANHYNLSMECNADCGCDGVKLYPVCDASGKAFFSPCHAGCREVADADGKLIFSSCSCAADGVVRKENCHTDCSVSRGLFFATVMVGSFAAGLGIVPGLLILIRSVPPSTRSAALGLQGLLVSLFGTLPSAVIWGFIVDSACIFWERGCDGGNGSCAVYDQNALRARLHIFYTVVRVCGLFLDVLVYTNAGGLRLLDEEKATGCKAAAADSTAQKGGRIVEEDEDDAIRRGSMRLRHLNDVSS